MCPVLAGIRKSFALCAAFTSSPLVLQRRSVKTDISMEHSWNDGKSGVIEPDRTPHSATCCAANLAFTDPRSNPGLRDERPANYRPNRGPV